MLSSSHDVASLQSIGGHQTLKCGRLKKIRSLDEVVLEKVAGTVAYKSMTDARKGI